MTQEIKTYDLALGLYLMLENCKVENYIEAKREGKPVLQLRIVNENPSKNLEALIEHYDKDLKPYLGSGRRGKIAVNSGNRDFEITLMRSIMGLG